jgi:putative FmdB family regulatory protein
MPIYEYRATERGCDYCLDKFEVMQSMNAEPLTKCPKCQAPIRRLISMFRACVSETTDEAVKIERKIRNHEREGRWSHAAELADKAGLEGRAKEDYKKAGYDM